MTDNLCGACGQFYEGEHDCDLAPHNEETKFFGVMAFCECGMRLTWHGEGTGWIGTPGRRDCQYRELHPEVGTNDGYYPPELEIPVMAIFDPKLVDWLIGDPSEREHP